MSPIINKAKFSVWIAKFIIVLIEAFFKIIMLASKNLEVSEKYNDPPGSKTSYELSEKKDTVLK